METEQVAIELKVCQGSNKGYKDFLEFSINEYTTYLNLWEKIENNSKKFQRIKCLH